MVNVRSVFIARNPTDGAVPSTTAADYINLPITGASGGFVTTEIQDPTIRDDRQPAGSVRTGSSITGAVEGSFRYGAFDEALAAALLDDDWDYVDGSAVKSASLTLAVDSGAKTITASAGTPFAGLAAAGDWVRLEKTGWSNDGIVFHVASKTDTVITYDYASAAVTTDASEASCIVRWGERITIGTTEHVYTLVKKIGQAGVTLYEMHTGINFDGVTLSAAIGQVMRCSFPYVGRSVIVSDDGTIIVDSNGDEAGSGTTIDLDDYLTTGPGYTAADDGAAFSPVKQQSAMWVDGELAATLKNITLTLANNTQGEAVLFQEGNQYVAAGDAQVTGSFNAIFNAIALMNVVKNNTSVAVQFYLVDSTGQGYIIDCPSCTLGSGGNPITNGRDLVQQQLRFSATVDATTDRAFSITRLGIA